MIAHSEYARVWSSKWGIDKAIWILKHNECWVAKEKKDNKHDIHNPML